MHFRNLSYETRRDATRRDETYPWNVVSPQIIKDAGTWLLWPTSCVVCGPYYVLVLYNRPRGSTGSASSADAASWLSVSLPWLSSRGSDPVAQWPWLCALVSRKLSSTMLISPFLSFCSASFPSAALACHVSNPANNAWLLALADHY